MGSDPITSPFFALEKTATFQGYVDLSAGTLIARTYEILGPLGRGGMGELFRARNTRTERRVALKLLRADAKHRADAVERFRREARAAGMINSDHVTQVLDVEDDPEHGIAIAFELLEGESLLERLRRQGPMDLDTIHPIVTQILRGLADAHAVGIIHRDLKPSNIFLEKRPDGSTRVKILDFGISKLPKQVAKTTLTEPGQSLGSFMFMPPEQIQRAASVDARADIYALGTLVFQAMTGHLPFSAKNMVELVSQKTGGKARTLQEASGKAFPAALEAWVARCLRLAREERFQSAVEAGQAWAALQNAAPSGPVSSLSPAGVDPKSSPAWPAMTQAPATPHPSFAPASPRPQPAGFEAPMTAPLLLQRPPSGANPAVPRPPSYPAPAGAYPLSPPPAPSTSAAAQAITVPAKKPGVPTWLIVLTVAMVVVALGVVGLLVYTLFA